MQLTKIGEGPVQRARPALDPVTTTYPVLVLVEMKFNTCPDVTAKYSGTFAGKYVAELFAVTTWVEPIVAHIGSVETTLT